MDAKAEKIALFRYGLIAPLILENLPRGELTRRAEEIAARPYDIPYSIRRVVAVDTLLGWAQRYRHGGFEALAPKPRRDRGHSRTITPQLANLIERLKRENPHRTINAPRPCRLGRWIPAWVRAWPERWSLRLPDEAVETWIGNR
jgi:putative transposase